MTYARLWHDRALPTSADIVAEIDAELERRKTGEQLAEEADRLAGDLRQFIRAAWHAVVPVPLRDTWHIDSIADHLQAAYAREIPRLLITIPPGSLKSTLTTVIAPAWRWTSKPTEQIVSASYRDELARRDTVAARRLIGHDWFQRRWPDVVLSADENQKGRYSNTLGGFRVASHVGGGTGERGGVLIVDDAHNAQEQHSQVDLDSARDWWGNTWASRLNANVDDPGVKIVIGQRIAVGDVIGFILKGDPEGARWTHLCLPEWYEPAHPFVYPDKVFTPAGRELQGDPRTEEAELLAPSYIDEAGLADLTAEMSEMTKAGQYQQRPAPREGAIFKRYNWRYYPADWLEGENWKNLPAFRRILISADTSFKEKTTSDPVAIGTWGVTDGGRYLLQVRHDRMGLTACKDALIFARTWALDRWPHLPVHVLVENRANGPEVIALLKREITGVVGYDPVVDKVLRAEACEPDFESHSVYVPGAPTLGGDNYDPALTPSWVQSTIEECSVFNNGTNDDRVDMITMALNWIRGRGRPTTRASVPKGRLKPVVGGQARPQVGRENPARVRRGR